MLSSQQQEAYDAIVDSKAVHNMMIATLPGSGKTYFLRILGTALARMGKRVAILMYNTDVCTDMQKEIPFEPLAHPVQVSTFHSYAGSQLIPLAKKNPALKQILLDEKGDMLIKTYIHEYDIHMEKQRAMQQSSGQQEDVDTTSEVFDFVLVDEFQDVTELHNEVLRRLEDERTRFVFVGDLLQMIYEDRHEDMFAEPNRFFRRPFMFKQFKETFRLDPLLCSAVNFLLDPRPWLKFMTPNQRKMVVRAWGTKGLVSARKPDPAAQVILVHSDDRSRSDSSIELMYSTYTNTIASTYAPTDAVVLSSITSDRSVAAYFVNYAKSHGSKWRIQNRNTVGMVQTDPSVHTLSTVHQFKGKQRKAGMYLDFNSEGMSLYKSIFKALALAWTGSTRFELVLVLVCSGQSICYPFFTANLTKIPSYITIVGTRPAQRKRKAEDVLQGFVHRRNKPEKIPTEFTVERLLDFVSMVTMLLDRCGVHGVISSSVVTRGNEDHKAQTLKFPAVAIDVVCARLQKKNAQAILQNLPYRLEGIHDEHKQFLSTQAGMNMIEEITDRLGTIGKDPYSVYEVSAALEACLRAHKIDPWLDIQAESEERLELYCHLSEHIEQELNKISRRILRITGLSGTTLECNVQLQTKLITGQPTICATLPVVVNKTAGVFFWMKTSRPDRVFKQQCFLAQCVLNIVRKAAVDVHTPCYIICPFSCRTVELTFTPRWQQLSAFPSHFFLLNCLLRKLGKDIDHPSTEALCRQAFPGKGKLFPVLTREGSEYERDEPVEEVEEDLIDDSLPMETPETELTEEEKEERRLIESMMFGEQSTQAL